MPRFILGIIGIIGFAAGVAVGLALAPGSSASTNGRSPPDRAALARPPPVILRWAAPAPLLELPPTTTPTTTTDTLPPTTTTSSAPTTTTTVPPTTTTTDPPPPPPTTTTTTTAPALPGDYAAWSRVAVCEEGGWVGWASSEFPDSLGIRAANWYAFGGGGDVSPAAQIAVADRLIAAYGASIPDQDGCWPGGW